MCPGNIASILEILEKISPQVLIVAAKKPNTCCDEG